MLNCISVLIIVMLKVLHQLRSCLLFLLMISHEGYDKKLYFSCAWCIHFMIDFLHLFIYYHNDRAYI